MKRTLVCTVALSVGLASAAAAQDWPQWRGPNRDGAVTSFREPATWPEALVRRWQVDVGTGYATPLLVGQRIYMFTRQGEDEVMAALDASSGKPIWRTAYPASFTMNSATARHGPGPKSTPTYADGRLFTLGMRGVVTAFDAQSGKRLWQKPGPASQPMYHTAMSPVVDGNLVIVHVGGPGDGALTAFDVATGDVKWSWRGDAPAYGSPVVATLGATRQVVTFTHEKLVGVAVATGQLLWERPYTTPSSTTSQTPLIYKDTIIESGRGNGITAFRPAQRAGQWATDSLWHTDEVSVNMSDIVAIDGAAFGLSHLNSGQYFTIDLDTGKVLWKSAARQAEHAAIARAGNTIFSLEDDGELVVLRHSRTAVETIKRYEVAASATWPQPAISGNRLFVKDVSLLTLWTFD
jgi:outer membrane protein assembly factor BamB